MIRSKRKYFYISIGTFILVALVGICIGWAISSDGENAVTAILIGITSGSFIYVAVLEVLPPEMKTIKRQRLALLPTLLSFLAGYGTMSLLALWA